MSGVQSWVPGRPPRARYHDLFDLVIIVVHRIQDSPQYSAGTASTLEVIDELLAQ